MEIDSAYAKYKGKYIVDFLTTPEAKKLFKKASKMFQQYKKAKYVENQKYIDSAHKFYNLVDPS